MVGYQLKDLAEQLVPPFLQSMNYCKKFQITSWIILFMNLELTRFVGYRVVILLKYPSDTLTTSIYYDFKSFLKVEKLKDWFIG